MKRFILHIYREWHWKGFEDRFEIDENTIQRVLLTNFDRNSFVLRVSWLDPVREKLPFNGFTGSNLYKFL